jgi:hypothetical protein
LLLLINEIGTSCAVRSKKNQVITEGEYFWVEEYVSNGGLDKIMYGMFSTETFYHSSRRGRLVSLFSELTSLYSTVS